MRTPNDVIVEQMRLWADQIERGGILGADIGWGHPVLSGIVAGLRDVAADIERNGEWTDQQDRLLRAAQDVVNDAQEADGNPPVYCIDAEIMDALKVVVQEISDDAVKAIEAIQGRPIVRPGGVE